MTDVHSREVRSFNMSQIKGKNTLPEMIVRRFLFSKGLRYKLHDKKLPGKPDIVLPKFRTIIDIRGCFWHAHPGCRYGDSVSTDSEIIKERRKTAVRRDKENLRNWNDLGWRVMIIWAECELEPKKKTSKKRDAFLKKLLKQLKNEDTGN